MNKRVFILPLIIVALLGTGTTEAAKWQFIAKAEGDLMLYIDTSFISGSSNGPKEAWLKYETNPPDCTSNLALKANKCIASVLSYERYLNNKSYCILDRVFYFTDGTDYKRSFKCNPQKVIPDTTLEATWTYLYSPSNIEK